MMDGKYSPTKNIGSRRDPDQGTDFLACPPEPGWTWRYGASVVELSVSPLTAGPWGQALTEHFDPSLPGLQSWVCRM